MVQNRVLRPRSVRGLSAREDVAWVPRGSEHVLTSLSPSQGPVSSEPLFCNVTPCGTVTPVSSVPCTRSLLHHRPPPPRARVGCWWDRDGGRGEARGRPAVVTVQRPCCDCHNNFGE
uniref:Uncharacterized protein n=1 Tax=Knipowitschia caucasica TaxID=637954 RepID=A0AAV2MU79_KNICA